MTSRPSITLYKAFTAEDIAEKLTPMWDDMEFDGDPESKAAIIDVVTLAYVNCLSYMIEQDQAFELSDGNVYMEDPNCLATAGYSWEGIVEDIEEAGAGSLANSIFDLFFQE